MKYNFKDLTGMQYGFLTVKEMNGRINNNIAWLCECKCGNTITVIGKDILRGHRLSCGCLRGLNGNIKRWETRQSILKSLDENTYKKIVVAWNSMIRRCSEKYHGRKDYFDRGICVCKEWLEFQNFANWAIMSGFSENLTLDRIDVNGNYEPSNCRWVDWKTQQNNKRNNRYITYNGETKTLKQWSETLNISYGLLKGRVSAGKTDPNLLFAEKAYERRKRK